ncbi:MAG: tryptophan synthase subunit alpha [Desulfatitalea sp.]|nr:tryptophan synthase subunit alpha [Desulfatitalea sp.]NNK02342.1 tryptophan synthase subunit alpha [Desulfatitalea sp.]
MLEAYIKEKLKEKKILLMTHIVIGYPSLADSFEIVRAMVAAGVDLVELQIPFSEPIADGPVILRANQGALAGGVRVSECLDFARQAAGQFDIPFLLMTYYNILFKYGVDRFAHTMADAGLHAAIVPDLPFEEGGAYLQAMGRHRLAPIFIFAPTSSDARMQAIARHAAGFVYCVARKGVTGQRTDFSQELQAYLDRCRKATPLPLALGFGVADRADVDFLTGKADIAVVGTRTIRIIEEQGIGAVGGFIGGLR